MPRGSCPAASRRSARLQPGAKETGRGRVFGRGFCKGTCLPGVEEGLSSPVPAEIKLEAVMEALRGAHRDAEKLKEQARGGPAPNRAGGQKCLLCFLFCRSVRW